MIEANWLIFAGALILNTFAAITIVVLVWSKRRAPGGKAMIFMFGGLAVWTFAMP